VLRYWSGFVANIDGSPITVNHLGDEVTMQAVVEHMQSAERVAKLAKLALDAGVREREVRIAESQAGLLRQVIEGVLTHYEIDLVAAQPVIYRQLALVAGDEAIAEAEVVR
jgi:hypothetical protein